MKEIVVYTQPNCSPCEATKNFLDEKGVPYIIKDVKKDKRALIELTKKYKSYSTPTVIIDDKVISGFNLTELEAELSRKTH